MQYHGARVLVTGGMGFLGSNLAIRLVQEGAAVTIVDAQTPGCGANPFNIQSLRERVVFLPNDIAEARQFRKAISSADVIFNLAGETSYVHSMQFPERDLQVNTVAQLVFLLECKAANRGVRVVYAGTRRMYGAPRYLPVDEGHPARPVDFNGIHKHATSMYHTMLSRGRQLDCIVLSLTNVYGPRMALDATCRDFLSTYVTKLMRRERLEVYGDGKQLRDPVFVDDVVNAFLIAGRVQNPPHRIYNLGGPEALTVATIADVASKAADIPAPAVVPFPPDRKPLQVGSFRTDNKRIRRELEWEPHVKFANGIAATIAYYRENLAHYVDAGGPSPACKLPEHSGARRRLSYVEG